MTRLPIIVIDVTDIFRGFRHFWIVGVVRKGGLRLQSRILGDDLDEEICLRISASLHITKQKRENRAIL
jgi:hypothetical protein